MNKKDKDIMCTPRRNVQDAAIEAKNCRLPGEVTSLLAPEEYVRAFQVKE